jgi:O-antigen/teichoic acid export membrane protein
MDLRQRFRSGFGWTVLGTACTQGSTLLSYVLVGNHIGKDALGRFSIVLATVNTFVAVLQMASGYTAAKYVSEFLGSKPDRAACVVTLCWALSAALGLAGSLVLILLATPLATFWLKNPPLIANLRVAALAIPFGTLTSFYMGALSGLGRFKLAGLSGTVAGTLGCMGIISTTLSWGYEGAVGGIVLMAALQCAGLHICLKRAIRDAGLTLRLKGMFEERSLIWRFAVPAALSGLTAMPAVWIGNSILSRQIDGPNQLGGFTAVFALRNLVLVLPGMMNTVGLSLLNSQLRDQEEYGRTFRMNFQWIVGAALIGSVGMFGLGPIVLRVFGRDFESARPILPILLISSVVEAVTIAVYQLIQTRGRMWPSFLANAVPRDCAIVLLGVILIPKLGAVGLAWAYAVSWALTLVTVSTTAAVISKPGQAMQIKARA